MLNLDRVLATITTIAYDAGQLILREMNGTIETQVKSEAYDIVTAADKAAEAQIVQALQEHYPDHHIVGEEGGGTGAPADSARYFWYIDPIDGTTNFAAKIPHFSTSIGLMDRDRQLLAGVIYHPNQDESFAAIHGGGAFCNGDRITVSTTTDLINAVVGTGFGFKRQVEKENNADQWRAFVPRVRGVRRMGSAALDLAYVAAGRFDGYWEPGPKLWDVAAGLLLVEEAGGTVTDYAGVPAPQTRSDYQYLATNGHIHQAMMDVLQSI